MSDCTQRVLSFSVPICTNCRWKHGTCVLEVKVIWFGNLNDTRSVDFYISLSTRVRLTEDGQSYGAIISKLGGTEPAADPVVMVFQQKQLSTANRATDPIRLHSVFKRMIEFK